MPCWLPRGSKVSQHVVLRLLFSDLYLRLVVDISYLGTWALMVGPWCRDPAAGQGSGCWPLPSSAPMQGRGCTLRELRVAGVGLRAYQSSRYRCRPLAVETYRVRSKLVCRGQFRARNVFIGRLWVLSSIDPVATVTTVII